MSTNAAELNSKTFVDDDFISDGDELRASKRRDMGGRARARGVFRLADTVPPTWQGQGEEGEVLKTRIQGLMASSTAPVAAVPAEGSELPAAVAGDAAATPAAPVVPEAEWPSAPPVAPSPVPVSAPSASVARTQFRVVPRAPLLPLRQDPNLPPRVITLAEIEAAKLAASDLQLVDAQAVARDEPEDPQMAAFQSMLSDYLKLEQTKLRTEDEDEYVYDLYYRDVNGVVGEGEGTGALLGYDESFSPTSTPPSSEHEDEADEDSNDEDYYRNDYPEDEDADEDMEGFEDPYSDGAWSADEHDDEYDDERDPWEGYR